MKTAVLLSILSAAAVPGAFAAQAEWQQCGGIGFSGNTDCVSGTVCNRINDYYSQCLRASTAPTSSTIQTTPAAAAKPSTTAAAGTTTRPATTVTSTPASASAQSGYTPASGIYPLGAVKTAVGTTYGGNWSGGTCSFADYDHGALVGVALGKEQWFGAAGCGACVSITGASGSVVAMVNNQCPECVNNHLDLETVYAAKVDKDFQSKGIFDISWKFVPCPVSGNIQLKNKEGTSAYYFAMQVRNSVQPIDKLEVSTNGGASWTSVPRLEYNYFTAYGGFGDVVDVRVTASNGAQIVQKGVKVSSGSVVQGLAQFSA